MQTFDVGQANFGCGRDTILQGQQSCARTDTIEMFLAQSFWFSVLT